MDDLKLKTVVQGEIDNALGYIESETTEERRKAINYYNRAFYGNEVEGRSTIVTGEVAEAVDAALPPCCVSLPRVTILFVRSQKAQAMKRLPSRSHSI
jgi:hypothetical protein